jgi:hypothetical protein
MAAVVSRYHILSVLSSIQLKTRNNAKRNRRRRTEVFAAVAGTFPDLRCGAYPGNEEIFVKCQGSAF